MHARNLGHARQAIKVGHAHHHVQHVQNMGPNLFVRNENHAYIMPCGTAHAVMSCVHHATHAHRQAGHPYKHGMLEITYGHAVHTSQTISNKNNCFTF